MSLKYLLPAMIYGALAVSEPALASDHHYADDASYFSSKYHHRHHHHWQDRSNSHSDRAKHWGRHHHHGIQLDGNDGRP